MGPFPHARRFLRCISEKAWPNVRGQFLRRVLPNVRSGRQECRQRIPDGILCFRPIQIAASMRSASQVVSRLYPLASGIRRGETTEERAHKGGKREGNLHEASAASIPRSGDNAKHASDERRSTSRNADPQRESTARERGPYTTSPIWRRGGIRIMIREGLNQQGRGARQWNDDLCQAAAGTWGKCHTEGRDSDAARGARGRGSAKPALRACGLCGISLPRARLKSALT
jgi:hypothetical protein